MNFKNNINRLYTRLECGKPAILIRIPKHHIERLYHRLKYGKIPAFIHVPKTGGTYVVQWGTTQKPVLQPIRNLGHCCVADSTVSVPRNYPPEIGFDPKRIFDQKELETNYFVVTAVRNIFDWLVSYWGHAGGHNPKFRNEDHYDYKDAQKGFEHLVRTIATREDKWPSRKFIHFQIFSYHGGLMADWINRTETLDEDLAALARYRGLKYEKKEKQRLGARDRDYRKYYSEELIELVYETWGRELRLFGYTFDGLDMKSAILKRKVEISQKRSIKYFWENDRLFYGNNEIK